MIFFFLRKIIKKRKIPVRKYLNFSNIRLPKFKFNECTLSNFWRENASEQISMYLYLKYL